MPTVRNQRPIGTSRSPRKVGKSTVTWRSRQSHSRHQAGTAQRRDVKKVQYRAEGVPDLAPFQTLLAFAHGVAGPGSVGLNLFDKKPVIVPRR